jgi:signal transduction histidine kinase
MNAVLQLTARDEETVDAVVLAALMEAWSESLAIVESVCVLRANRAFAQMFGYSGSPDVQGRRFSEFVPESQFVFPSSQEVDDPQGALGNRWPAHECNGTCRDGTQIRIQVAASAFRFVQHDLLVISIRGFCERTLNEKQLLESEKMEAMGRLVGGVAHDFNNLLTGILLYCDLLIAGLEHDGPLRAYAEEIRRAGGHSAGLIQQLLTVARPQADDTPMTSWDEVISGTWNLLARLLGENIELVTDLASDGGSVTMSPAQMRQVLLNLLLNARDAMPEGGRTTMTAGNRLGAAAGSLHPERPAAECVELTVTDTGCGMDAETRSRLFENFFTTKQPGQGSGLGLATVGRIVKAENGTIEVETAPGRGTRVTVCLPRAGQRHTQQESDPRRSDPARARKTDLNQRRGNQP